MRLKLNLRVLLAGHTVAMVADCAMKLTPPSSAMIGQFFDTMIVSQSIQSGYNDPSKSTSWKVLEAVLSHLKHNLNHRWAVVSLRRGT